MNKYVRLALLLAGIAVTDILVLPLYAANEKLEAEEKENSQPESNSENSATSNGEHDSSESYSEAGRLRAKVPYVRVGVLSKGVLLGNHVTFAEGVDIRDVTDKSFNNDDNVLKTLKGDVRPVGGTENVLYGAVSEGGNIYELSTNEHGKVTEAKLFKSGCKKIFEDGKYRKVDLQAIFMYKACLYREQGTMTLRNQYGDSLVTNEEGQPLIVGSDFVFKCGEDYCDRYRRSLFAHVPHQEVDRSNAIDPRETSVLWRVRALTDAIMAKVEKYVVGGEWLAQKYFEHSRGQVYTPRYIFGDEVKFADAKSISDEFRGLKFIATTQTCIDNEWYWLGAIREGGDAFIFNLNEEGELVGEPARVWMRYDHGLIMVFAHGTLLWVKDNEKGVFRNKCGSLLCVNKNGKPLKYNDKLVFFTDNNLYVNSEDMVLKSLSSKTVAWLPAIDETKYPTPMILGVLTGTASAGLGAGLVAWKALKWGCNKMFGKRHKSKKKKHKKDRVGSDVVASAKNTEPDEQQLVQELGQQIEAEVIKQEVRESQQEGLSELSPIDKKEELVQSQVEIDMQQQTLPQNGRPQLVRARMIRLMGLPGRQGAVQRMPVVSS